MKARKVIRLLVILPVLFLFLGANPNTLVAKEKFEEKFERTESLAKDGKVILKNISGDIEVKSWDKSEVKINALKVSKASTIEKAKENARRVEIEVIKEGKTLRIETKYPRATFKSLNVSVNFQLMVPKNASVKLKSVSGDLRIGEVGGQLDASTVSGDIHVEKAHGGVECESVSGDLEVQEAEGDISLKSVSGDITLMKLKGSVEAESVSGDIKLLDVSEAKSVKASTLSGDVLYKGQINPNGRYSIKSHSGDVKIAIPADSAFDLEAKTFSGDIESDFDITISGKISKKELRGTINGGGADVNLKTFSGDIHLQKK